MKKLATLFLIMSALVAGAQNAVVVKLKTSQSLGSYLADKDDRTLYFFSNDADGKNNCTGGCITNWPIFSAGDLLTQERLSQGLLANDFGTTTTASGQNQVTYKGWPLYYYSPRGAQEAANLTSGDGAGNVWYAAKPDYTVMLVSTQLVGNDGKNYKGDYAEGDGKTAYLTDSQGRSLYAFKNDKANKNNFTKEGVASTSWIVFEANDVIVPSKLDKSLFSTIDVFGKKQLTYNGWPLYYFGRDEGMRGSNKGVSVPQPGTWPIAAKDIAPAPTQ